jgi:5'-methylthioadenosine phosphorylase
LSDANLLLLLAVVLPPKALDLLGPVVEERVVETRFGTVGPLALRRSAQGTGVWVQPYSGLPSRTDPRATLLAAKHLGVHRVLNWDAGVAVNPLLSFGQPAVVLDYIDFTRHQPQTFFESEGIGAIDQDPPVCPQMTAALSNALGGAPGGVYLGVDGPRRETAAEARMFRLWGVDMIGQNIVPEITLATELELCYAGLVTIEYFSADQQSPSRQGEVRRGLEMVIRALPDFVHALAEPATCGCADRLSATRHRGLLAEDWWRGENAE